MKPKQTGHARECAPTLHNKKSTQREGETYDKACKTAINFEGGRARHILLQDTKKRKRERKYY